MSKVEETLSLLTPGSVWLSAKGTPSYVICVTNENIPVAKAKQFPPQVVFADEEGEVYSVGLDRFLEHRSFHHVEYDLEQKIENLFVSEPKSEDETEGADDAAGVTEVLTTPRAQSILELEEAAAMAEASKDAPATSRVLNSTFQFEHAQGLENPMLNNIVLSSALRSFSQEPNISERRLMHRLTFLLDAAVTMETLEATFSDSKVAEANRRGVVAITLAAAGNIETILWDSYLGTYPIFTDGGAYGMVLLASDIDVNVEEQGAASAEADAEVGALMGDGNVPATQVQIEQSPANEQPALSPAEAFVAHVERIEAEQQAEVQPALAAQPVQQQAAQPVEQPAVNVVQINPQQNPSQNGGN